jgi:Big-like domain-containing protein
MTKFPAIGIGRAVKISLFILLPFILSSNNIGFGQNTTNSTNQTDSITQIVPSEDEVAITAPLVENQMVSIFQNQTVSIPLSPGDSRLDYFISKPPLYGKITDVDKQNDPVPGGIAVYTPNTNFVGSDFFTFWAQDSSQNDTVTQNSEVVMVTINVNEPPSAIIPDIITRDVVSFVIAIIAILVVTLVARRIIRRLKSIKYPTHKSSFSDMIRGQDMVPSLSVFQFLLWTYVLMFAFIGVYFVRIFGGVSDPPQ